MNIPRTPAGVCSRIGLGLFCMMLIFHGTGTLAALLAAAYAPALLENGWFLLAANTTPLYLLGMPVFLVILGTVPNGPAAPRYRPPLGPWRFALVLVCCLGISYAMNLAMGLLLTLAQHLISPGAPVTSALQGLVLAGGPLPSLVFAALLPAVGEEFLFRYMLHKKLRGCGEGPAIFFGALCFGLFHGNLVQMPYTFVIGAILGWLYVVFGKLWLTMLAHFLINLLGAVLLPWALQTYPDLAVLYGLGVAGLIVPGGVALFFATRRRAAAALLPPAEPGWPWKPPKPLRLYYGHSPHWPAEPAPAALETAALPAAGAFAASASGPSPALGLPAAPLGSGAAAEAPLGPWNASPRMGIYGGTALPLGGTRPPAGGLPLPAAALGLPPANGIVPAGPGRGAARPWLKNTGMALFILLSGLLTLLSLAASLGLFPGGTA